MNQPLVSIVMLCWNRKDDVQESLKRIREIEYVNFETIVVDNFSTDGTQEMIEKEFSDVKLLKMFENIGIEAYNIGFENAKGKYIVILDDDSFPEKHAVTRMVERFERDEKIGIVAFDVRNYFSYDDIKNVEQEESQNHRAASKKYIMSFNGAGAGIRADLFKQAGYYPEEFFLYYNEMDTALRVIDLGYKVETFSDIVSYHKHSPQNRKSWRAPFYYTRNAFWLVWKNFALSEALKQTICLIYYCIYYSFEQRTSIYLKACLSAFFGIRHIKGKRKPVDRQIIEQMRIPFNLPFTFYR